MQNRENGSGSVDIGATTLKRAADLFAGGDTSDLTIHIIVHNAALVDDNILEEETAENINTIFNVNGSCFSRYNTTILKLIHVQCAVHS